MVQFHFSSQQAKNSSHKFMNSEMARQFALSAQEEAFKYLCDQTASIYDNDFSDLKEIARKLINKDSDVDMSSIGVDNRNSINGIELEIPATQQMADEILPGVMDIKAVARIVDFCNQDYYKNKFYDKEGLGTIEIAVTVKPKEKKSKNNPGSCTLIRHHDYKVVSIVSKKDERPDSYCGSSMLDYVLFVRKGQEEFDNAKEGENSLSLNPVKNNLEIDATDALAKINFGSSGNKYQYLNISSETKDLILNCEKAVKIPELELKGDKVDEIYPQFKNEMKREAGGESVEIRNHKAVFEYYRVPLSDEYCKKGEPDSIDNLETDRGLASLNDRFEYNNSVSYNISNNQSFFPNGIKIKPIDKISEILESDVRKRFFNYGYFKLDLSECSVIVDGVEAVIKRDNPEYIEKYNKLRFPCYNAAHNYITKNPNAIDNEGYKILVNHFTKDINTTNLTKHIKDIANKNQDWSIASKAFTCISDTYAYCEGDEPPFLNNKKFYRKSSNGIPVISESPEDCQYPYAHFILWNKRSLEIDSEINELEEFGIYEPDKNLLHLRGIVQCMTPITLGKKDSVLEVDGCGVLIATDITIEGEIKKKDSNSLCILFARDGKLTINTNKPIQAALIAMGKEYQSSSINCKEELNLEGAIITDRLELSKWKENVTHKITYDKTFAPTKDIYQIYFAKWVTFERILENE